LIYEKKKKEKIYSRTTPDLILTEGGKKKDNFLAGGEEKQIRGRQYISLD